MALDLQHKFEVSFFIRPQICVYCQDYIWGSGFVGYKCVNCSTCIHSQCSVYSNDGRCSGQTVDASSQDILTKPYDLTQWSSDNVREWMAVVNLHRYSDVFYKTAINGLKLIQINTKQLNDLRIADQYHHEAILNAIEELKRRSAIGLNEMLAVEESLKSKATHQMANSHFFVLITLTSSHSCHFCNRHLLGILHQGLICQSCGILVHRQCSRLCAGECKPSNKASNLTQMHLFGANLFDLMSSDDEAPLILRKSCEYLEKKAAEQNADLYDIYRLSSDTTKQNQLKKQLNQNGVELTNYDLYDLNTIASIVKAFLKELQNSLIPEEDYLKFIKHSIDTPNEIFTKLVDSLHPIHYKCLKYVCRHLIKVWLYQYNVKKAYYTPDKLIHIFRTIILRPKWTNIIDCVYNLDKQSVIVKRLLIDYNWGVELPLFKERPVKPVFVKQPTATEWRLEDELWFWPDITRYDTMILLKHTPDGTFLVRKASDSAQTDDGSCYVDLSGSKQGEDIHTPFILSVVKGSVIKSIKIFQNKLDSSVDIELPNCRFKYLRDLIDYYTQNEITELNLKLVSPLSKYEYGYNREWDLNRLYKSYYETYQQLEVRVKKFDGITNEIDLLREDYNNKLNALNAYEKIIDLYSKQIDVLKSQSQVAIDVKTTHIQLLQAKINDLNEKASDLKVDCDYLMTIQQQLIDELEQVKPELHELRKKRENYHMWLIQRGENDEKILNTLKAPTQQELEEQLSQVAQVGEDEEDPFMNTSNWYSTQLTRDDSEVILKSRQNGTFLVRTSTKSKYVLSIVCLNEIKHCLIDEDPQDACCFIKPVTSTTTTANIRKFSSLKDLIVYYRTNSLKNYNSQLDICLLYPAFAKQQESVKL